MKATPMPFARLAKVGIAVALASAGLVVSVAVINGGPASAAGTIVQTAPTKGSVAYGTAATDQLHTSGGIGPVTFATDSATVWGTVSSTGAVSAPPTAAPGTYFLFGTDSDTVGDQGQWQYALTVTFTPHTIFQAAPTSGSVTTTASSAFTDQLNTTDSIGPATYAKTGGGTGLTVSSSGKITTTGTLAAGTYTATGTTVDAYFDTGKFTYTLTVSAHTITQATPTSGSVTTTASSAFTDQLKTTGNIGPVTFAGGGAGLAVSTSGKITTTRTLAKGQHTATGTTADAFGDTGTFTYTLTVSAVTIAQGAPTSGSVTTTGSAAFIDHLKTTGNIGAVTFAGGGTGIHVSASGKITTTGTLAAGTYTATGTTVDAYFDKGAFTYTLTVSAHTIAQATPTSGSVTTTASSAFTDQLKTTGNIGPVTFTGGGTGIHVSASGKITTTGTLAKGPHAASGTTADAFGDTGNFSYTLTVSAVTITQAAPTSGSATTTASSAFTDQLTTTGNSGPVTFTKTGGGPGLTVSASGKITTDRHPGEGNLYGDRDHGRRLR